MNARTPRPFLILVAIGILSSAIARPAWAQPTDERPARPGFGYQFSHNSHEDASVSFPLGFLFHVDRDLTRQSNRSIGVAAQFGLAFHSEDEFDQHLRLATFLGGPQVRWQRARMAMVARFLAGLAAVHSSATFQGQDFSDTNRAFAIAGEGGVEIPVGEHTVEVGARLGQQYYDTSDLDFTIYGMFKIVMNKLKKK